MVTNDTERIREHIEVQYDGSCDVCGEDDVDGYYRVVYTTTIDDSDSTVEHECFECHEEAKCRDRQREREEFAALLV